MWYVCSMRDFILSHTALKNTTYLHSTHTCPLELLLTFRGVYKLQFSHRLFFSISHKALGVKIVKYIVLMPVRMVKIRV